MKNFTVKIISLILLLFSLLLTVSCQVSDSEEEEQVVNVYNWGEYMDLELLDQFEEETGIKVIYSNFANNEDLYVKIKHSGASYDLIFPSEYMLERMIQEDLILPINMENVPNIKFIDKQYLNHSYDPEQKYSVPYFWGTLGIVYNKKLVDDPVDSWDILWNEKYAKNIIMQDSSRDSLAVALSRRGFSINSKDLEELKIARDDLIEQYPLVYAYLGDQARDIMKNGEAAMAVMFSGDAVDVCFYNEDLAYAIPKEGSNLWFDVMAIPANAKNKENAEAFINFLLDPEVAAQNASWVGYSLPSSTARELLDEEYRDNPFAYPPEEVLDILEVFNFPGDFIEVYDEMWQEVKSR